MKNLLRILSLLFILICSTCFAGISDDIENALKTGKASSLAQNFNTTINLNIPGNEGTYSKAQAELILKDFFSKNPVKTYTTIHQGESKDGAKYSIGNLITKNASYRTYCYTKQVGDKFCIKELRIEND
jgi:hypothetical protein